MTDEQYEEIRVRAAEAQLFCERIIIDIQRDWDGQQIGWDGTRLLISPGAYADLRRRMEKDLRWDT